MQGTGRPCSTCVLPRDQRAQVTTMLSEAAQGLRPRSIASIAREIGLSAHALHRHVRAGHETRPLPGVITPAGVNDVNLGSLTARLLGLADAAAEVRRTAAEAGHRGDVLRALDSEGRTLAFLLQRLGLTEASAVEALGEATTLARAVGDAAREDPHLAEAIARHLEARGGTDIADDLRRAANG